MNEQSVDQQKEEREAILRIAGTLDGKLLHRYLRRELESVSDDTSHGALAAQNGRRSFARNLMSLMAQAIEQNRERTDEPALAARSASPIRVAPGGPRRRVSLSAGDPWSEPDPTDDTPGSAGSGNAA